MSIDITMAAAKLDLNENNILTTYAKNYGISDVQNPIEKKIIGIKETKQYAVAVTEEGCVGLLQRDDTRNEKNQHVAVIQSGYSFRNDNFQYNSESNKMSAFFVPNPSIPGAMGVRVHLESGKRYFFSSGSLSGCGVAMLMKGNDVYFIHAGADSGSSAAEIGTEERRKLINRDIFRMAQLLDEKPHELVQNISQSNLRDLLIERNFVGVVLTCADEETNKKEISKKVAMLDYDTKKFFHNMIGVANESGICVGKRSISQTIDEGTKTSIYRVTESAQYKYVRM